jgi:hypothetical protein
MPYNRTPKIVISMGDYQIKNYFIGVHVLPYHQTLGDKKLHLAFFKFQLGTFNFCLVMGVLKNFYKHILFIYLMGGVW